MGILAEAGTDGPEDGNSNTNDVGTGGGWLREVGVKVSKSSFLPK